MKSASSLRLSYMLRNAGYEVLQVHNCLSFTSEEIEKLILKFSEGRSKEVLICVSTSFIATSSLKNVIIDYSKIQEGEFWGPTTFSFFLRLFNITKKYGLDVLMGGWGIQPHKFFKRARKGWGIDELDQYVSYYVTGNNIDIIQKVCNREQISFTEISGSKLVEGSDISDYSDCASTPLVSDMIMQDEALSTEIAAGCVFSCQFCNYAALGKKKYEFMRTYESLEQELVTNYENFRTRVYLLSDNIMNDYEEKLKYLIRIREKKGIDIRWVGYVRLDTIKRKEQAQLLVDSGMAGATFGIESMKKEAGPSIGKMTDKDKLLKSLEIFRTVVGDTAVTTGSFIAGLPTETPQDLMKTYKWLNSKEGREYIDSYVFTSLILFDNKDKNEINKSRNDPFRDYIKTEDSTIMWKSPWGEAQTYMNLAKQFNQSTNGNPIGAFGLPFLHNVGMRIENSVKMIRTMNKEQIMKVLNNIRPNNQIMIDKYKKMLLEGV